MIPLFTPSQLYPDADSIDVAVDSTISLAWTKVIVLVDDNVLHHHANLAIYPRETVVGRGSRARVVAKGTQKGGCRVCFDKVVNKVRQDHGFSGAQAAREWIADQCQGPAAGADNPTKWFKDDHGGKPVVRQAQKDHREDPTAHMSEFKDLKYMQGCADQLARALAARHGEMRDANILPIHRGAEYFGVRVDTWTKARNAIIDIADDRPIDIVCTVGHGFEEGFHIGNTCRRMGAAGNIEAGDIRVNTFVDAIADSLATHVRWVLYHCSTAGDTFRGSAGTYHVQSTDSSGHTLEPVAAHLLRALHGHGKTAAEVWAHIEAGNAMEKPHWVRMRMNGGNIEALSLLDYFRSQVPWTGSPHGDIGAFGGQIRQFFGSIGYPEEGRLERDSVPTRNHAKWFIPHWPVNLEEVDFSSVPDGPALVNVSWNADQYRASDGSHLCARENGKLYIDIDVTVLNARNHSIQVMPKLDGQTFSATRPYWLVVPVEEDGAVVKRIRLRLPGDIPEGVVTGLSVLVKLWNAHGEAVDELTDEEVGATADVDDDPDPITTTVRWESSRRNERLPPKENTFGRSF